MNEQVKGVGELLAEAWTAYRQRGLAVLGVLIVTSLVTVVCVIVLGTAVMAKLGGLDQIMASIRQGQLGLVNLALLGIFFVFFILLALWSQCAVMAAVLDDSLTIMAAMRVGWQKLWGFGWVLFLVSAIVAGGFVLFILPGIFFSISLLFAVYFYLDEDLRGMDAVLASHYAVKGRWWNTMGKLFLLWLMAVALQLIPVVGQFLYFIFLPFLLFFLVALYRNLRATAAEPVPSGSRLGWSFLAALGVVIPMLGMIGAVVTLGPQLPELLKKWQQAAGRIAPEVSLPNTPSPASPAYRELSIGNKRQSAIPDSASQWNDPVGDVEDFGTARWLDIERVRVKAADTSLWVDLELHYPLTAAYNAASTTAQSLQRIAILYMDTDMKWLTGNVANHELVRGGYDLGVDITLEVPRNRPLDGNIHVALFRIRDGKRIFSGSLPEKFVHLGPKNIRLRLPYNLLGVHSGGRMRMSFVESAQKQGSGLAKDKIIAL